MSNKIILTPDIEPVRVFFRGKHSNSSNNKRAGDFKRSPKDICGISTWRPKIKSASEIYNNFRPQFMGMFRTTIGRLTSKELTDTEFQCSCFDDDPAHVSIHCSKCDKKPELCKPSNDSLCPIYLEPGSELYILMSLFELHDEAIFRSTSYVATDLIK